MLDDTEHEMDERDRSVDAGVASVSQATLSKTKECQQNCRPLLLRYRRRRRMKERDSSMESAALILMAYWPTPTSSVDPS